MSGKKFYRLVIPALFIAVCGSYLLYEGLGLKAYITQIRHGTAAALLFCTAGLLFFCYRGKLSTEKGIALLVLAGCLLRILYMLETPVTQRSHDLFEMDSSTPGKAGYLLRILQEHRLPESNELQLYQQPFFFILGAGMSGILNGILQRTDPYSLVDAAKVVSCLAACFSLLALERLLERLTEGRNRICGMLLLTFTPVFLYTGGRFGENALCFLFVVLALLYTLKFEKEPSLSHILVLAVVYGCGMMTKISCAVPALYTAYVFGRKWKEEKQDRKSLTGKYAVFGSIALPLGMWYSVRNLVRFGQELWFIPRLSEEEEIFHGGKALMARFVIPDIKNIFVMPYANPYTDFNLPAYLIKTELFGEFRNYQAPLWLPTLLLMLNVVLSFGAAAYGIFLLINYKRENAGKNRILVWGLLFGFFAAWYYFKYPFGCTMDCRYYMMLPACKAMLLTELLMRRSEGKYGEELMIMQEGIRWCMVLLAFGEILWFGIIG